MRHPPLEKITPTHKMIHKTHHENNLLYIVLENVTFLRMIMTILSLGKTVFLTKWTAVKKEKKENTKLTERN